MTISRLKKNQTARLIDSERKVIYLSESGISSSKSYLDSLRAKGNSNPARKSTNGQVKRKLPSEKIDVPLNDCHFEGTVFSLI